MADAITIKALQDASLDAKSLEEVVNGDEAKQVTTRLGENYPSVKKALKTLFENGGLPAILFDSYNKMQEGMAELGDGDLAVVINDPLESKNGYYIKQGGELVPAKYSPEALAKSTAKALISDNIYHAISDDVFAFVGEDGRVGVTFDVDANVNANNINSSINDPRLAFAVEDVDGNIGFAVSNSAEILSPTIKRIEGDIKNLSAVSAVGESADRFNYADYMHVFTYGQSLARGAQARPIISTSQPYSNVTFLSGVLPRPSDENLYDASDFKPLVEEEFAWADGESPTSAMLNEFVSQKVNSGEDASDWIMVGTGMGNGGQSLQELSKGSVWYEGFLTEVNDAMSLAHSKNASYAVACVTYTQGEANYNDPSSNRETYSEMLEGLKNELSADIASITGQNIPPVFIGYQTASHRYANKSTMHIALAQLDLSNKVTDYITATPIYMLDFADDNLHLTNNSSHQLGKYYGLALDAWERGEVWQPLQPVSITKQGLILNIVFNKKGLVFDTEQVVQTYNYGFDIFDGNNLLDIIDNVQIKNNRVTIKLSSEPAANAVLSYARGRDGDPRSSGNVDGARGNLRDSAGNEHSYVDSDGKTRYMHNWCVMFEYKLDWSK